MPDSSSPVRVRFEILGPLRAIRGDEDIDLGPAKQRTVLAVLLIHANRPVSPTTIIDTVWRDDPPANGPNVVQKHIAGLRRILEPERSPRTGGGVIALTDAGYVLTVEAGTIDVDVFDRLIGQARTERASADVTVADNARAHLEQASAYLREAVGLHRTAALAGLSGPVIDAARDRFTDARIAALETCADVELALGRHDDLVPELAELVIAYPVRERLRWLLMLALYRAGRQAEALAAYREAQRFLDDEFGVQPGTALTELHQRILRSDPDLMIVPPPRPPAAVQVELPPAIMPGAGAAPTSTPPTLLRRAWRFTCIAFAALLCLASFGLLNWAVFTYYAARRRSVALAWCAAGYFVVPFVAVGIMSSSSSDAAAAAGVLLLFCLALAGFMHVIVLHVLGSAPAGGKSATHPITPALVYAPPMQIAHQFEVDRRFRRQRAREIVATDPDTARQMLIGAPHLMRTFDDGGLIDINAVPEQLLSIMLGLAPQHAHLIAIDRFTRGPFRTVDELVQRGLLDPYTVQQLQEYLIVVPPPGSRSVSGAMPS